MVKGEQTGRRDCWWGGQVTFTGRVTNRSSGIESSRLHASVGQSNFMINMWTVWPGAKLESVAKLLAGTPFDVVVIMGDVPTGYHHWLRAIELSTAVTQGRELRSAVAEYDKELAQRRTIVIVVF